MQEAAHVVQVQTHPPAHFPPEQQLAQTAHVFFLLISASAKVNPSFRVDVSRSWVRPQLSHAWEIQHWKESHSHQSADAASLCPVAVGCWWAPTFCWAVHTHHITFASTGSSPGPQHLTAVKQHCSGQGWSKVHLRHWRESWASLI